MPGFVLLGVYFQKYRNIAFGIVTMGSGIATFVLAPLLYHFIDEYGYRGSMILMAGILSHLYVVGAVLRPVNFDFDSEDFIKTVDTNDNTGDIESKPMTGPPSGKCDSETVVTVDKFPLTTAEVYKIPSRILNESQNKENVDTLSKCDLNNSSGNINSNRYTTSMLNVNGTKSNCDMSHVSFLTSLSFSEQKNLNSNKSPSVKADNLPSFLFYKENMLNGKRINRHYSGSEPNITINENLNKFRTFQSSENIKSKGLSKPRHYRKVNTSTFLSKMSSDFIAHSYMSLNHFNFIVSNAFSRPTNETSEYLNLASSKMDNQSAETTETKPQNQKHSGLKKVIAEYSYVLLNKQIFLLSFNVLLLNLGLMCAYVYLPAFAMEYGSTPFEASRMLSVMGISNIICRMLTGLATNQNGIDTYLVYTASSGLAGIVLCVGPFFCRSHYSQMVLVFVFGLYANCFITLMSPLTIDLVGVEHLSAAYGLQLLMCGIGALLGPPIAGM